MKPQNLEKLRKQTSLGGNTSQTSHLQLKFSADVDVGMFIRIWWSRYQRFFYGVVTDYNPDTRLHQILYEDSDLRSYDMSTKTYELVHPPAELGYNGRTDVNAVHAVSTWHQRSLQTIIADPIDSSVPDSGSAVFTTDEAVRKTHDASASADCSKGSTGNSAAMVGRGGDPTGSHTTSQLIKRSQSGAYGLRDQLSCYQIQLINAFHRLGGFSAMFQSLRDCTLENESPQSVRMQRHILL